MTQFPALPLRVPARPHHRGHPDPVHGPEVGGQEASTLLVGGPLDQDGAVLVPHRFLLSSLLWLPEEEDTDVGLRNGLPRTGGRHDDVHLADGGLPSR